MRCELLPRIVLLMNATSAPALVFSTSTAGESSFEGLDQKLQEELLLTPGSDSDEEYWADEYCFVCKRATDHRGEHDDLVEAGKAAYDQWRPYVSVLG